MIIKAYKYNKKVDILRHNFFFKEKNYKNNISVKEYTPIIDTTNENPVVTENKEKERLLHQTILFNNLFKFTINNYYDLNLLLRDLTSHQLYNQPFIDKKSIDNSLLNEKRGVVLLNIKEKLIVKEELKILKKILKKIKQYKKNDNSDINNNHDYYFLDKILNYIIIKKNDNYILKKILKNFNLNKAELKKTKKFNILNFLENIKNNIKINEKLNKNNFFNESKKNIFKKDKLEEMANISLNYVEKNNMEKIENQYLLNTVKKYNDDKKKINWKNEFNDSFILKNTLKDQIVVEKGPDLSRRK